MILIGLDPKNLEISVMQGKATMKNLKLKSSILEKLELPVVVKAGLSFAITVPPFSFH